MAGEGFDPINFTSIKDIERNFGKKAGLGYIRNLQDTLLDEKNIDNLSSGLSDQLIHFIKNPDKGSDFESKIKNIPANLSNEVIIKGLFMMGYGINAKILPENNKIISFVAYQEDINNNLLKIFKLHTDEEYRGGRLTYELVNGLLSRTNKNIQIGKGSIETDEVNTASEKLIQLYADEGDYEVDQSRFIIYNNLQSKTNYKY